MLITNVVKTDQGAIMGALHLFCNSADPIIVDVTYNKGRMWKNIPFGPTLTNDIDPSMPSITHMDYTVLLPLLRDIDVIIHDPPHMQYHGETSSRGMNELYGLSNVARKTGEVSQKFNDFFVPAYKALTDGGLALVKMIDFYYASTYQSQVTDLENSAKEAGFTVITKFVKVRQIGPQSPKWEVQFSPRNRTTYWVVLRKGKKCYRESRVPTFSMDWDVYKQFETL